MSFSIEFVPSSQVQHLEVHDNFLYGRITIGDFSELFETPLVFWSVYDYENHWKNALARIVHQSNTSCLITSIYNPKKSNFLIWWPFYREGDIVHIHNQIFFYKKAKYRFDINNPYQNIGPRRIIGTNGKKISEWSISVEDIINFMKTMQHQRDKGIE